RALQPRRLGPASLAGTRLAVRYRVAETSALDLVGETHFVSSMNEDAGLLAPAGGSTAGDTSVAASEGRPAILLVDDQPARLLTYEAVLNGLDVTCVRAHSGEEALAKLLHQRFAVILLDVKMPGMDGFEV